jgi:methylphosphotriester-DNA--protein-cysteine methyltransferase
VCGPPVLEIAKPKVEKPKTVDRSASITVYITRTGKKYHRAGCTYLRRRKIPISLKEALARGYTPCSRCKPPRGK